MANTSTPCQLGADATVNHHCVDLVAEIRTHMLGEGVDFIFNAHRPEVYMEDFVTLIKVIPPSLHSPL